MMVDASDVEAPPSRQTLTYFHQTPWIGANLVAVCGSFEHVEFSLLTYV